MVITYRTDYIDHTVMHYSYRVILRIKSNYFHGINRLVFKTQQRVVAVRHKLTFCLLFRRISGAGTQSRLQARRPRNRSSILSRENSFSLSVLTPDVKQPGREGFQSPPSNADRKICGARPRLPYIISWCGA